MLVTFQSFKRIHRWLSPPKCFTTRHRMVQPRLQSLEDRLAPAFFAVNAQLQICRLDDLGETSGANHAVVFFESALKDYDVLRQGLGTATDAVLLDSGGDGLREMAAFLAGRHDLSALGVVAHGAPGMMELGTATLDPKSLGNYAHELAVIGSASGHGGELDLWSCVVAAGEHGAELVRDLAANTGMAVAAADHPIGDAALGGTWQLDIRTPGARGEVPFAAAALGAFHELLGTWSTISSMANARYEQTATLLGNGKVLVTGGGSASGSPQATAELFDPSTNSWSAARPMTAPRLGQQATLLPSGKVLVTGGGSISNGNQYNPLPSAELYDPVSNTWSSAGSLATARIEHTATLLDNGKVLVTGGLDSNGNALSSAELYNPVSNSWTAAASMTSGRAFQTATALPSGLVLIAGGGADSSNVVASAELYDPVSNTWSAAAPMATARAHQTATLLSSGAVLIAGGRGGNGYLSSAEMYDPVANSWSAAGPMKAPRSNHTATPLGNGMVMVTGGANATGALSSEELYDPIHNTWSPAGAMATPRAAHTATLLGNGKVLVTGGLDASQSPTPSAELYDSGLSNPPGAWNSAASLSNARQNQAAILLGNGKVLVIGGESNNSLSSAELYDPITDTWSSAGSMANPRSGPTATLLGNGKVLVAGGAGNSAELYDPVTNSWSAAHSMTTARGGQTATLLGNGKVLVAGGYNAGELASAELYNPVTNTWTSAGTMATARNGATATLLGNGKVLITGGTTTGTTFVASAELYDPVTNSWSSARAMTTARGGHTATLLTNGLVLVVGGANGVNWLASAELYNPVSNTWSATGSLATGRFAHTATLLDNGDVLVTGGQGDGGYKSSAELYDPVRGTWSSAGSMSIARFLHTATLLSNGQVLIVAGFSSANHGGDQASAELYDPAGADPAQSTISVTPATILIGGSTLVTLTAKDATGKPESRGGLSFSFALGTGAGSGTFSNLTDAGNGTYTATFTGTGIGQITITATLGGLPLTSPLPTITVNDLPGTHTATTVQTSNATPLYGASVTLTATVAPVSGSTMPTQGSVAFFHDGNTFLGTGTFAGTDANHDAVFTYVTGPTQLQVAAGLAQSIIATYTAGPDFIGSTSSNKLTETVTPAVLSVTGIAANDKVYDRTTLARLNTSAAALAGILPGDTVTLVTASAVGTFANKDVGNSIAVAVSGLTLSGAQAGDYTLRQPASTANITPAPLTIRGMTTSNKVYDATSAVTVNMSGASLVGVLSGDTVTLNTAGVTGSFASKDVGNNVPVSVSDLSLGGAQAADYTLTQAAFGGWTQFQGDAAHTGTVPDVVNPNLISPEWTLTSTALGANSLVQGVVTDGSSIYVTANMGPAPDFFTNFRVYQVDQTTGSTGWNYAHTANAAGASAPSVLGGTVYAQFAGWADILDSNPSDFPYMVGINAATGQQLFASNYDAQRGFANQPTVQGNAVFAHAGYYGGFRGYNAVSGATLWNNRSFPGQTNYIPAADDNRIYVYMGSAGASPGPPIGTFYAINRNTGRVDFQIQNTLDAGLTGASNVVLGGQNDALVSALRSYGQAEVLDFDLASQTIRWRASVSATGAMAVANGRVYVPSGDRIDILDEATGTQLGQMVAGNGQDLSNNVLVTANLVFASSATRTFAFDRSTLAQVWSTNDGGMLAWGNHTLVISNATSIQAFTAVPALTTANITPATLAVSGITANNKVYDATAKAILNTGGATLAGAIGGDTVSLSGVSGTFASKDVGTGIPVTVTALTLGGAQAADYAPVLKQALLTANITPAPLTATVSKIYDATTLATVNPATLTLMGVFPGDAITISASGSAGTFATKDAGHNIAVTVPALTLGGAQRSDYTLTTVTGTIVPAPLTVTGLTANSKVYDGTTTATVNTGSAALAGAFSGDSVVLATTGVTGAFTGKDAGSNITVTISGLTLTGPQASDYALMPPAPTANITPAPLTVTGVTANDKVYDDSTAGTLNIASAVLLGIVGGDALTMSTSSAHAIFASKDVGTGITVTIFGLTLQGASAHDYTLTPATVTVTANITPAPLAMTGITAKNKVYDGTTTATVTTANPVLVGLFSGDSVTLTAGVVTGTFVSKDVGNKVSVLLSGLSFGGAQAGDYVLPQLTTTANITPAPLTATGITANNKVYDTNTTATLNLASAALAGAIYPGDVVSLVTSNAKGTFASSDVGNNITVTVSGLTLTGAQAGDYALAQLTTKASIGGALVSDDGAGNLSIDLGANESLAIVSKGTSYVFGANQSFIFDSGTNPLHQSTAFSPIGATTLTLTSAGLAQYTNINIADSQPNASVTFNDSGANVYGHNFTVTVANNAGGITFNGGSNFASANLLASANGVLVSSGASVTSTSGNLTFQNRLPAGTNHSGPGIAINGSLSTGSGQITIQGAGGNGGDDGNGVDVVGGAIRGGTGTVSISGTGGTSAFRTYGVWVSNGSISSTGGNVQVTGVAGHSANLAGVFIDTGGRILAGGDGNVTVQGTGSVNTQTSGSLSSLDYGVYVAPAGTSASTIGASGGDIHITGQGSTFALPISASVVGVYLEAGAKVVAAANHSVTLDGTGGATAVPGDNYGVYSSGAITLGGSNVRVIGSSNGSRAPAISFGGAVNLTAAGATVGLVGDGLQLGGNMSAPSGSVTISPKTSGTLIDLGGADKPGTLGLTNAELGQIAAGALQIGDANSGTITVSAPIALPAATDVRLSSGGDIILGPGSINTHGGALTLAPGGTGSVQPTAGGTDVNVIPASLGFAPGSNLAIAINGTTVDTQYSQLNVAGDINLTGVNLLLSGIDVPATGQTYTIVSNNGTHPVIGTFNGLPEGAVIPNFLGYLHDAVISYVGGDGNDVVLTVGPGTANGIETRTAVTTSAATSTYGQPVAFTATVTAGGGTPTGTVEFFDRTTGIDLGAGTLLSTSADTGIWVYSTTPTQLEVTGAAHVIDAVYSATGSFLGGHGTLTDGATITPFALTVTGITANDKLYDGTTAAILNTAKAALVNVYRGDKVTLNAGGATGTFASKAIANGIIVTVSGLTLSGPQANDYTLTQPTTSANITHAPAVAANDAYSVNANQTLTVLPLPSVTSLTMHSQPGELIGQGRDYAYTSATGAFKLIADYQNGVSIFYGDFHDPQAGWNVYFDAPLDALLTPGTYVVDSRNPNSPGMSVYGESRGASTITGHFTVYQAVYNNNGVIVSFDATFVQYGDGVPAPLSGEIKYNATPPSGVLSNDFDAEGNHLTAVLVTGPTHGSLSLHPDGTFAYQPNADFTGTDSFTYKANDEVLDSNVATVSLQVNPVATSTTLTSSLAVVTYGTPVIYAATVTASAGTPTGSVEFFDDTTGADLGAGILQSSSGPSAVWSYTTKPTQLQVTAGAHAIRAVYTSLGGFSGSSGTLTGGETVLPLALTVSGLTANDKAYDATTHATLNTSSAALVGVVSGDSVTLDATGAIGTFATKAVGSAIPVTVAGLTIKGPRANDYVLIQPTTTANITPSVAIHPLSAMKGIPATITSALLTADAVDAPSIVIYTLVTAPTSGTLKNGGTLLATGSTFTQADINANKIAYLASAVLPDSFQFTVTDGLGGTVPITAFVMNPPIINSISALEGTSGLTAFNFHVTLPAAPAKPVTFDVFTSDGTAVSIGANANFVPIAAGATAPHANGTVTFAAGQVSQMVTVYVIAGSIPASAGTKSFTVSLSSPAQPAVPLASGTGTILPQGTGGGATGGAIPKPTIGNVSQLEGQSGLTPFNFHVSLSAAPSHVTTYDVYTTDGTALAGTNYVGIIAGVTTTHAIGQVTFAPGQVSQTITVYVIGGSVPVSAGTKTFTVSLSDPANPRVALGAATGTIIPQGPPPTAHKATVALSQVFAALGSKKIKDWDLPY